MHAPPIIKQLLGFSIHDNNPTSNRAHYFRSLLRLVGVKPKGEAAGRGPGAMEAGMHSPTLLPGCDVRCCSLSLALSGCFFLLLFSFSCVVSFSVSAFGFATLLNKRR